MPKRAQIIPPEAYPQLVNKSDAASVARALRSPAIVERGARVIEEQGESLHTAVHDLVDDLEKAGREHELVLRAAHEIRGLAGTAGLAAAGRIADGLCRYFDESEQLGVGPDMTIVRLHIGAIARAARAEDEVSQMSEVVAKELAALVNHKLTEIKALLA
jgi:HPt (histidine-containing phosphotransfer) domain-containing protein